MLSTTRSIAFPSISSGRRRGGVIAVTLAALSVASVGTVAVLSIHDTSPTTASGTGTNGAAAKAKRMLQPGDVAVVFRLLGIGPEALAASGLTANDCSSLFDTGTTYCLQAERITQLQLAHRNVNLATERAVHPDAPGAVNGQGQQIALADCQTALSDLESAGFTFVTSGMDAGKAAKLSTIRANQSWGLTAPYLTVSRTGDQWLALRGALVAKRYALAHSLDVPAAAAQVIADAEADPTVSQALTDYAGGLGPVTTSWNTHEATP